VETALDDYRAAGIAVIISTSIPLIVQIQLQLTFQAGIDTVTLSNTIQGSVVEFVNSLPVNGPLYISQLYSVLQRFAGDGLIPSQTSIVSPVGDLVPAVGQTIRTVSSQVVLLS